VREFRRFCVCHRQWGTVQERLHDVAAEGRVPEPARDADAAAAGISLSAVAGTVAANYQTCHETAEQLTALQGWVKEMTRSVRTLSEN
jgi:hypothetical protein